MEYFHHICVFDNFAKRNFVTYIFISSFMCNPYIHWINIRKPFISLQMLNSFQSQYIYSIQVQQNAFQNLQRIEHNKRHGIWRHSEWVYSKLQTRVTFNSLTSPVQVHCMLSRTIRGTILKNILPFEQLCLYFEDLAPEWFPG